MQAEVAGDLQRLRSRHGETAALVVVVAVPDRNDGVEAVVPSEHAQHHEDAIRRSDGLGGPGRRVMTAHEGVEHARCAAGHHPGTDAHPDQLEEAPTIERGAIRRLDRMEVSEGVECGDVRVEHGDPQATWNSGMSRMRATRSSRSNHCWLRACRYSTSRDAGPASTRIRASSRSTS